MNKNDDLFGVAIIGMSGRFPGADSVAEYWENILNRVDSTRELSVEEIIASGVEPELAKSQAYIRRGADLEDIDKFDAGFFDYLPAEAKILDPQVRLFLECIQAALDDAGCDPERYDGSIGVYAGSGLNNYLLKNILRNPGLFENLLDFQTIISSDKDFLSTQVNYKFNLTGPGLSVQTACSTSLVAIQLAYQSLLTYQCDIALSGGTHIRSPRAKGNPYKTGEIFSPDGICRPFDKDANGTIFGEGAGVVVLKRLEDAIDDGDHIYGVIRGAAINNDGKQKVSYAAPSVKGQAEVIAMAQTLADIDAGDLGYVEAHGTGTTLGDPIEIRALTQAFRLSTDKNNYCAIGSGKSMIGHLDVAAGVAGFIRATLALYHKTLPPTLHFNSPNPELKLDESPFYVCSEASPWADTGKPRLAAVSSFGVGGTNAHAVLQEAPNIASGITQKKYHLLPISAKTSTALKAQATQLSEYFSSFPNTPIADVAYTLQTGRREFAHRKIVVCKDSQEAIERMASSLPAFTAKGVAKQTDKPVMFMFSGQGSQYMNMCRELYQDESVFRSCVDSCAEAVIDILGFNFTDVIFSDKVDEAAEQNLKQTFLAQPALYAMECGLARLWSKYGVQPQGMIGHSIGEFASACIAGVFTLEEGARIVAVRGKLMQQMEPGAMLSLRNAAEDVEAVLEERDISVVVINGPELTVVGGTIDNINKFKAELEAEDIPSTLLHTSHAFHSSMMDNAVAPFVAEVNKYHLNEPSIPFISNVTGDWITPEQAVDPGYWGKQIRSPVQFARGIETLCSDSNPVLLEVGPGQALSILCQQQAEQVKNCPVVSSARHPNQKVDDTLYFYRVFGALWANGADVDLGKFYDGETRKKTPLPSYPFERKSYWINSGLPQGYGAQELNSILGQSDTTGTDTLTETDPDVTEKTLAGIVTSVWEELLGVDDIELKDNFFELGGHSLVASQMLTKVQDMTARKVTLSMLNESENLGEFCDAIEKIVIDKETVTEKTGRRAISSLNLKQWHLSPQQERLWFYYEYYKSDPAYNLAQTILIQGKVNQNLLQEAVDHVLSIHESFNTVFNYDASGRIVASLNNEPVTSTVVKLSGSTDEQQEAELVDIIISNCRRRKDFSVETVNAVLYEFSDDRIAIVLYIPHIITDGLSFNIFSQQIDTAYQNLTHGRDVSDNIEIPYQYSDYVEWSLTNKPEEKQQTIDFWHQYLKGIPDLLQLPTSSSRPVELSSQGSGIHFSLSSEQSERVRRFCDAHKITPFVFFLSQLYLLLWKYSGQTTQVIGAPYANRDDEGLNGIVGFFVDMLPIRGDIDTSRTFAQWIREINQSFSKAWDNFEIGLDKIVEASEVRRHNNAHPLFQVTFTYLSYLKNNLGNDNYSMRQVLANRGISEYDLSLYMWDDEEFTGLFEFSSDLFDEEFIERLQGHFATIIDRVLSDSDQLLSELSILTPSDIELINRINQTHRPEFLGQNFVEKFNQTAQKYPDKTAVRFNDISLNYDVLNRATNNLARQLKQEGIGKGNHVGVYSSRGINNLVALIAILKSGATYIPLDPHFPADRLRYIIDDSGMDKILVDKENRHNELITSVDLPVLEVNYEAFVELSEPCETVSIDAADLAYMIYTSGSTGKPKGVPIKHESLANFLHSVTENPGITENDRLLAITTTSFDISLLELLLPLVSGATLVIADTNTSRDVESLSRMIEQEDISYLQATPVTWSMLLEYGWQGKAGLKILSGGEALTKSLSTRLLSLTEAFWNAYGPTEATIWSSFEKIIGSIDEPFIGLPMANTSYYVLDEHNRILPPGIIGELAISGTPLSTGYKNRDDLTRRAFVEIDMPDSHIKQRVYKTGDLALQTIDGNFRCLGRKDFQVKIRGFRIELGEIEDKISTYHDISEVVCNVLERSEYDKQIVAYYIASNSVDEQKLRAHLQQSLPDYMIPSLYIRLDEFPTTPNAKVDRKQLANIVVDAPADSSGIGAMDEAENDIELRMMKIWQELLNSKSLSFQHEFFDVGGNSLLAVQLFYKINEEFNIKLPISTIFTHPSIRLLSEKVIQNGGAVFDNNNKARTKKAWFKFW